MATAELPSKASYRKLFHSFFGHLVIDLNVGQSENAQNISLSSKAGIRGIEYFKSVAFIKIKCGKYGDCL